VKHKALIILELLLEGHRVKIQDYTYALSEANKIGYVAAMYDSDKPEIKTEVVCHTDMSLNSFVKLCESVPDDQISLLTMNAVITDVQRAGGMTSWVAKKQHGKL